MPDLQLYWLEFLTIATVHLLAVASPGPDFAIVIRHSVSYGRRIAVITSIGIGAGILIHVAYSLFGLGILIQTTPWLYTLLTYVAGGYLLYLGYGALRSTAPTGISEHDEFETEAVISGKRAFWIGLLTNGLNPKATLFFLSLFAGAISAQTPNEVKLVYGLYMVFATGLWFCALSLFLGSNKVRHFLRAKGFWFDRLMGVLLIALAIKIVLT